MKYKIKKLSFKNTKELEKDTGKILYKGSERKLKENFKKIKIKY